MCLESSEWMPRTRNEIMGTQDKEGKHVGPQYPAHHRDAQAREITSERDSSIMDNYGQRPDICTVLVTVATRASREDRLQTGKCVPAGSRDDATPNFM